MQENSWHPNPATERSAALVANSKVNYLLLDATPKDNQNAVHLVSFWLNDKEETVLD